MRSFGTKFSDLELDLSTGSRPVLVTRLLMNCSYGENGRSHGDGPGQSDPEKRFWDLTVGDRISHLLLLAFPDDPHIGLTLACPNDVCSESMEIPLDRDALVVLQQKANSMATVAVNVDEETIVLRKPLGVDQMQWLGSVYPSEMEASRAMIRTLRSGDDELFSDSEVDPSPDWIDAINEAMEEADPLVNFVVSVTCPSCSYESSHVVDLEALAISRLRKKQHQLLRTVHTLASHYHWTEQEILSLPPWRRSHYLSLIVG